MKQLDYFLKGFILLPLICIFLEISARESFIENNKNSSDFQFSKKVLLTSGTCNAEINSLNWLDETFGQDDTIAEPAHPENSAVVHQTDDLLLLYCDASTANQDEYIANVLIGSINTSSGWQGGVANYTGFSTILQPGGSQQITITNGTPYSEDQVSVWVDWNNDYTFATGANEEYILTNSGGNGVSFVGNISVPEGTIEGDYRMRIRMTYNASPVPCGIANYGEIEDYTIKVRYVCPTVDAGPDQTIVEDQTCQLNGNATDYSYLLWTSSGDGIFDDAGILAPLYTPGPGDIITGSVELCLQANPVFPCITPAINCMTLSFQPCCTSNAGNDASICESSTHTLAGSATNYSGLLWTTSGSGTFSSATILNPIYTPSNADILAGKITLTLNALPIFPCTIPASDKKNLVIKEKPAANAGDDSSICLGTETSLGAPAVPGNTYSWSSIPEGFSSTLANPIVSPLVTTTYTVIETITATGCSNSNSVVITVYPLPEANAGADRAICLGSETTIGAAAVPGNTYSWTSVPEGFTSTLADPTVAPEINTTYTLLETIIATGCTNSNSVVVQVNPIPEAMAGNDTVICQGSVVTLGAPAVPGNTYSWTSVPEGFTSTLANPVVAPVETTTYSVVETITSSGCTKSNSVVITVNPSPAALPGNDRSICFGSVTTIGAAAVPGSTYSWSSVPEGFASNLANPAVSPQETTIYTIEETITATGCTNSNSVTVTVNPLPAAIAGSDRSICKGSGTTLGASAVPGSIYNWTSIPVGFTSTLANPTVSPVVNTTYTVIETITATGCTNSNSVVVTVNPLPAAVAGPNRSICLGTSTTLGAAPVPGSTYSWTSIPAGFSSTLANPTVSPTFITGYTVVETIITTGCSKSNSVVVIVNPLPEAPVANNSTVCYDGSAHTATATPPLDCSVVYYDAASGGNIVSAPAGTESGTYTAWAESVNNTTTCTSPTRTPVTLNITAPPIANAGDDDTVCVGNGFQLSGTAQNYSGIEWTTTGTGTFSSTSSLTAIYTPSTADIQVGNVTLILSTSAILPCLVSSNDNMVLFIQQTPTSNAGIDTTICQTETYQLSGSASNNSSVLWSTSGTGTFNSTNSLTAIYTPSTADIEAGTVTLTLTAPAISPCEGEATDDMILIFQKSPTAVAGNDATICEGMTHELSGAAEYYVSIEWTTSGTGTFSSTNSLNTIYTPSIADIESGMVTITLTASAISPCEVAASDDLILFIQNLPTVNAGDDSSVCQGNTFQASASAQNYGSLEWTSSGTGTFNSTNSLTAIYTPSMADIEAGTVTLTLTAPAISPCEGEATDDLILIFQKSPTAVAGNDATICEGMTHELSGAAENYVSIEWTTSGTGTFSSTNSLNTIYTPSTADIEAGTITLTLTASAISPCEEAGSDDLILFIQNLPTVNAGDDSSVCQGNTFQASASAQNYGSLAWTSSGTGTFNSTNSLTAIYTPSTADIEAGTVTLTLTAPAISPCEGEATDDLILIFQKSPTAAAGNDATICEGMTHELSGAAEYYVSIEWTTSGTGTFSSTNSLNTIYAPSTADIEGGMVTITLTASAISPCEVAATDDLILFIQNLPIVNAGDDSSVCQGNTFQASASAQNYGSLAWTSSGTGTFNSTNSLTAIYTPSTADIEAGTVTLTLTAPAISPCEGEATDDLILIFQKSPTAVAGNDATICEGMTHELSGAAEYYVSIEWTTSGTGTFNSTNSLNTIYTPSIADIEGGMVTITLTASAISPCEVAATDDLILFIQNLPTVNAGDDSSVCQGNTFQASASAQNYGSLEWTSSGTGTFSSTSSLTPVYTPSMADIEAGTVTLTLTASAISPCEVAATDDLILIFQKSPTADAGNDATICQGENANLSGNATNFSAVLWATSGDGTFENPLNLATIYFPGTNDITNGTVDLTLFASAQLPCTGEVAETLTLTILPLPEVSFAPVGYFCQDSPPYQLTEGSPEGGVYSGPFVVDGWFYPADAGTGTFLLTYTYIDEFGCENSAGLEVDVQDCTSIDDPEEKSVSVMPNPGNGNFILHYSGNINGIFQMRIYNSTGELLLEQAVPSNEKHKFAIDLTSQPNGIYFLMLSNGDETMITKKLVIRK